MEARVELDTVHESALEITTKHMRDGDDSEAESNFLSCKELNGTIASVVVDEDVPDCPKPNFFVEGSGVGDSSVTVGLATFSSACFLQSPGATGAVGLPVSGTGNLGCVLNESAIGNVSEKDTESCGEDGSGLSGPISIQSSEDMKLSLVSWYSEPEGSLRDGCSSEGSKTATDDHDHFDEKENKTPGCDGQLIKDKDNLHKDTNKSSRLLPTSGDRSSKPKMHVTLQENRNVSSSKKKESVCKSAGNEKDNTGKPGCTRCARKSQSGSATPHATMTQAKAASRRVVQVPTTNSNRNQKHQPVTTIKPILKTSRSGSGSGSENKSSMDSLGSATGMSTSMPNSFSRSDSGLRAKYRFSPENSAYYPEDKMVSKLKRIEKYATLRLSKNTTRALQEQEDHQTSTSKDHRLRQPSSRDSGSGGSSSTGSPGVPNSLMTKSMSVLEKSHNAVSTSALKRQGSLKSPSLKPVPVPSTNCVTRWDPPSTRTSALRLQKMQEARAKRGGSNFTYSADHSGHNHNTSFNGASGSPSTSSAIASSNTGATHSKSGTKDMKNKIFLKLSSAFGQTASSNMKRLKQERSSQTDEMMTQSMFSQFSPRIIADCSSEKSEDSDYSDKIKRLERMARSYKCKALKFQHQYEKAEGKKFELQKQLKEAQVETNEMIEFLQAEKSTLMESLTEVEHEAQKLKNEVENVKKESQSRCSSLIRLSEQHKQEALKSLVLLNRSDAKYIQLNSHFTSGVSSIQSTKQRIVQLTHDLLDKYKVPKSKIISTDMSQLEPENDLSRTLLFPLISSLSKAFPISDPMLVQALSSSSVLPIIPASVPLIPELPNNGRNGREKNEARNTNGVEESQVSEESSASVLCEKQALQNLTQAILEREEAEGLDSIPNPLIQPGTLSLQQNSIGDEIEELNVAISRLLAVVRLIIIYCNKKVNSVTADILQCLNSMKDEQKAGEMKMHLQPSLEAWNDDDNSASEECNDDSKSTKDSLVLLECVKD